jgi:hypothetical protein
MSKLRRKVPCPVDKTKLGYDALVEVRANGEYIYYCRGCNTYWIVTWVKKLSVSGKSWVWAIKNVRDDFGRSFDYIGDKK